ncbi:MAG TPA: hypothetical protein VFS20_17475, partial [Longimicrobium sp.]|nr:hypothetical protein [Longimicrobium sp.]
MARSVLKSLAIYLLLVGVPVAGLAAILRAGVRLHAPPAIAGEWRVEGGGPGSARTLVISQSGQHVEVAVASYSLRGIFTDDTLTAESRISPVGAPGPCFRATAVRLRARVDTAARPMRLRGALQPNAPGCAPVP